MASVASPASSTIDRIADKVYAGERLSPDDALALFAHPNLLDLATLADFQRQRLVPGRSVGYVVGRILNYTNVCWVRCKFCAFYRVPNHPEGYLLSDEQVLEKVEETVAAAKTVDRRSASTSRSSSKAA
jgi:cyclic dehypoxanthinyl futalosine synthase